ncbi:CHAT domain-containing protein [Nocardioides sp. J2M5]|uniref:CHAT domain-containing protein n=1 Tax=Nocardioides palaemonis TaxID=2829810 RepID=UPI001BAC58CC|nr:CHAT domain-containing protein [Nocardioides palaemonis]MBS2938598.1 CHAT domain-containing protein [Nocardioides palaemonis]
MSALEDLRAAVLAGDADAWLAARPELLTAETATAALDLAEGGGPTNDGYKWAVTAEAVFRVLDDREGYLRASLHRVGMQFLAATTAEQYASERDSLIRIAAAALTSGLARIAGRAMITAADCSYWAHETLDASHPDEGLWARRMLNDCVIVWEQGATDLSAGDLERLASLTAGVIDHWSEQTDLYYDDEVRALGARLVQAADAHLPHDLFERPAGATKRAVVARTIAHTARVLRLGVTRSMAERLEIARTMAEEDGDMQAWVTAARGMLIDAAAAFTSEHLDEVRRAFYATVDPRTRFRSRLGRLAEAARLDELVGEDLAQLVQAEAPDVPQVFALAETASARTLLDALDGGLTTPDDETCRGLERSATAFPTRDGEEPILREMRLLSQLPVASVESLEQLEQRYVELGAGFAGESTPVGLAEVQGQLQPREVMVRYVLPFRWSHPAFMPGVVVVTPTEAAYVRLPDAGFADGMIGSIALDGRSPLDTSALGSAVLNARLAVIGLSASAAARTDEHLTMLHDLLIAPVRATGLTDDATHWIVVPQRSLHLVPWMAVRDAGGRSLLDDVAISVVPSASSWSRLRERAFAATSSLGFLADPLVGYAGLPQLPGALAEMEEVTAAWTGAGAAATAYPHEEATLAALAQAAQTCSVVHVAAHGSFPDDQALFDHQLMLSPDDAHAGPVTADALRGVDLAGVDTVVLSVCDGGAYRVGQGDEPYGLVPALLEAGAASVVAAQWAVDDESARALMSRTGVLLRGHPPAEALRQACLERREVAAPGDWTHAAFVAVGGRR